MLLFAYKNQYPFVYSLLYPHLFPPINFSKTYDVPENNNNIINNYVLREKPIMVDKSTMTEHINISKTCDKSVQCNNLCDIPLTDHIVIECYNKEENNLKKENDWLLIEDID